MKKLILSLIAVLLFTAIVWSAYYIISKGRDTEESSIFNEDTYPQPTLLPTPIVTEAPTEAPEPTVIAKKPTVLYPVSQIVDDEMKYGYINEGGEFEFEPIFETASDFHDGLAVVMLNGKYRVIDEMSNIIFSSNYSINDFSNGMAVISSMDESGNYRFGYINGRGQIIIEPQYAGASDFREDGSAYVFLGQGRYAQIDSSGSVLESFVLSPEYDNPQGFCGKYIITVNNQNTTYGVISLDGKVILESKYSDLIYLGDDLFAARKPGLETYTEIIVAPYAIFNHLGEQLTDYSLYDVTDFNDGYASASNDSSTFFIGHDGKEVTGLPRFEGIGTLQLFDNIVKARIDNNPFYSTIEGMILWQEDTSYQLSKSIVAKEVRFRPNRNVLVYYPSIEGLSDKAIQQQINLELQKIFADVRAEIKLEEDLVVSDSFHAELVNNLLIIERSGYDYYIGAAHGMPFRNYYYIDINTGAFYAFKDLFQEGSDYASKINQLINAEIALQIQSEESMLFADQFTGIAENPNFILNEDSIIIYFTPYEIAAYAAGFLEFLIPYEDIEEFISKDGAFWRSYRYQ